jgi:hypothetical protein
MPICEVGRRFDIRKFKYAIALIGIKNGVNLIFTTPDNTVSNSVCVYLNGQRLTVNEDYSLDDAGGGTLYSNRVTFVDPEYAPQREDILVADYVVF